MKSFLSKIILVAALFLLPLMEMTNAQYFDKEISAGNNFSASSLDLVLQDRGGGDILGDFLYKRKLKVGDTVEEVVRTVNQDEDGYEYYPKFEYTGGDLALCDALTLTAEVDGNKVYAASLSEFDLATESAVLADYDLDIWTFSVDNTDEDVELQGATCEFDILFQAYIGDNDKTGFWDEERLSNSITTAYEPLVDMYHDIANHRIVVLLSNLKNIDGYDGDLKYVGSGNPQLVSLIGNFDGEDTSIIYIDLGIQSGDDFVPHANPHDIVLELHFRDKDEFIISTSNKL